MSSKHLLTGAIAIALSAAALASPGEYEREDYYERRGPLPFEVMDLNGDGTVTAEEHAQVREERHRVRAEQGYPMRRAADAPDFDAIDRDGNGAIDRDELSTWQAGRMQQRGFGR